MQEGYGVGVAPETLRRDQGHVVGTPVAGPPGGWREGALELYSTPQPHLLSQRDLTTHHLFSLHLTSP